MSENNVTGHDNKINNTKPNARDVEICRLYIGNKGQPGLTLQALGERFHISRERVRQILRRENVFKKDRHIELSGRDQFLGINITEPVKLALREEAQRRGVSVSALSSETLSDMLAALGYLTETHAASEAVPSE